MRIRIPGQVEKKLPRCSRPRAGMFDSATLTLEEIAPEDKNRKEVLRMRVQIYMAAKKSAGAPENALSCGRDLSVHGPEPAA
jgi:hypothetical protein